MAVEDRIAGLARRYGNQEMSDAVEDGSGKRLRAIEGEAAVFAGPAGAADRPALPSEALRQSSRRIPKTEAEEVWHSGVTPFGADCVIRFLRGMPVAQ